MGFVYGFQNSHILATICCPWCSRVKRTRINSQPLFRLTYLPMASLSVTTSQFGVKDSSSVRNFAEVKELLNKKLVKLGSSKSSDVFGSQSWEFLVSTICSPSKREQFDRILDRSFRFNSVALHSSSTTLDSPFTEKYSPKRSQGRGLASDVFSTAYEDSRDWACTPVNNPDSVRHQIADQDNRREREGVDFRSTDYRETASSQLPELREVLTLLRRRWDEEAKSGKQRKGPGNVFLVGTGPGDPELLTVKALRLMQTADLVLYDRLVSTDILDLVHAGARLLYVGKTSGYHSRTQEEIHELLLNFAEAGATVVRLKGGDPLVFGRGGEEMDFLQEQGIKVNVIPGITAASGIAAELGIPLTHRGAANSVRFLTGHSRKGGEDPLYVAEQAADPDSTLVVYMGLATLAGLAAKLMAHGLPPNTPAAAIERGTTPQQRMVFGALEALPELVSKTELVSPTLIFIGKVVALSPLWPSGIPERGVTGNGSSIQNLRASSPSLILGKSATKEREPRDRRQRGPDPALPSEL